MHFRETAPDIYIFFFSVFQQGKWLSTFEIGGLATAKDI